MVFVILPEILFFQNIKIKVKSRTWMTLKSSLMIFQALEPLQPQQPHRPLQPQWPQQPLKPYFIKKVPDLDNWIVPGTKMTNTGPFLWNGSSKIQFLLISATFPSEAVEASQCYFFEKLVDETQISKPLEATGNHIQKNHQSF